MITLSRINPSGMSFTLIEVGVKTKVVHVVRGKEKSINVDVPIGDMSQMWYNWQMRGQFVQEAFKTLSAEEREFLMTGITPEEWKATFKGPEV